MAPPSVASIVAARISAFQNRPSASFGTDQPSERSYLRKQGSLGNLEAQADGASELAEARARLKHIGEDVKSQRQETRKPEPVATIERRMTTSSVLEELDDLLDTAIGENSTQFLATNSGDSTDEIPPDWPLSRTKSITSKSPPEDGLRYSTGAAKRRQSRQRHNLPASRSETVDPQAAARERGPSIDSDGPRSSTETERGQYHTPPVEVDSKVPKIEMPTPKPSSENPIKQRTALFEMLSKNETAQTHETLQLHDVRVPTKIKEVWPPIQGMASKEKARDNFIPSREKHYVKFHRGENAVNKKDNASPPPKLTSPERPKTTHVPPIPLTLPQLVRPRRQPQAEASTAHNASVAKLNNPRDQGDGSYRWPLRWDVFAKAQNATIKESSIVARAEPDHHVSPKRTHDNQHRVHDLLTAAHETPKSPTVDLQNKQQDKRWNMSTGAPVMPGTLASSPRGSSAAEKEVTSQSASITPARSITPSTPRGRAVAHPSKREHEWGTTNNNSPVRRSQSVHRVEQRFALSRSQSRGRGGVTVQVDISSPNLSPDRGGDAEYSVRVTADVAPLEEMGEGGEGGGRGRGGAW